uniref:alpha-amylase family glycosyl hydrolase n=1 Tax=Sphingopyxis terrae TaxID=33052 RepID=UPI0036D2BC62
MSRPSSTYRVQLTPDFGFAQVAEIAGYLRDLGVSHVYLSPILQSTPESRHGYDVIDHSRIRAEFGGATGFREMAQQLAAHDLGIVVDIVPNHMNPGQRAVLVGSQGRSRLAVRELFDIDWSEGKVALPVLWDDTDPYVDGDVLRYHDHAYPYPGHYRLADWREGPGYRRFFDVSSLIGLRVEDPSVLFATHEVIFWLLDEGLVDGLRVDHPDGLADPRGYSNGCAPGRARRGPWWRRSSSGPSGCRATGPATAPLATTCSTASTASSWIPPEISPCAAFYGHDGGSRPSTGPSWRRPSVEVIDLFFGAEVGRLADAACKDPAAVRELLAAMPVYRAYVVPGEPPPPESVEIVELAAEACSPAVLP